MKKYIKSLIFTALAILTLGSCSQTDAEKDAGKTPAIEYVRVCFPDKSDSLLVEASMGQRIALIGNNLGDVNEIWFNDQKAKLNPALVTSNSIIVDVPNIIPTDVNNTLRILTSKGLEITYPFGVVVPNPVITNVNCQYGVAGDIMTITGDYFLSSEDKPLTVTFPGDLVVTPDTKDFTKTQIKVTIPQGADKEGNITVTSMYGSSRSSFKFLDTTGLITNFDDGYENPWGYPASGVITDKFGKCMEFKCDGNAAWNWTDKLMWGFWSNQSIGSGDLSKLYLVFECNIKAWSDCPLLIWFAKTGESISPDDDYAQAHWKPWNNNGVKEDAKTDGWITVSIPLTDFKYNKAEDVDNLSIGDISQYTNLNVMMFGAADAPSDVDILFDNFRLVSAE